jgi:hypothetical protein
MLRQENPGVNGRLVLLPAALWQKQPPIPLKKRQQHLGATVYSNSHYKGLLINKISRMTQRVMIVWQESYGLFFAAASASSSYCS